MSASSPRQAIFYRRHGSRRGDDRDLSAGRIDARLHHFVATVSHPQPKRIFGTRPDPRRGSDVDRAIYWRTSQREKQVLDSLTAGASSVSAMRSGSIPISFPPPPRRRDSDYAHLIKLIEEGRVVEHKGTYAIQCAAQ